MRRPVPSLRWQLMLGILLPVALFMGISTVVLYRQALAAADTAYDRTLLASAKSIGEQLQIAGEGATASVQATLQYSSLEAFEADNRSRIFYRVTGFADEMVSGFADLPPPRHPQAAQTVYAALVEFYDDSYRNEPVRMAVLRQPVASQGGQGLAVEHHSVDEHKAGHRQQDAQQQRAPQRRWTVSHPEAFRR